MKVTIRLKTVGQLMSEEYLFNNNGALIYGEEDSIKFIAPQDLKFLGERLDCEEKKKDHYYHANSKTSWPRSQIAEVFQVLPIESERYNLKKDFSVYSDSNGNVYFALKDSHADKNYKKTESFTKIELEP